MGVPENFTMDNVTEKEAMPVNLDTVSDRLDAIIKDRDAARARADQAETELADLRGRLGPESFKHYDLRVELAAALGAPLLPWGELIVRVREGGRRARRSSAPIAPEQGEALRASVRADLLDVVRQAIDSYEIIVRELVAATPATPE